MSSFFPVTDPIGNDADRIIAALKARSEQIKNTIDSQGIFKKVSLVFMKTLGLAAAVTAAASVPVAFVVTLTVPATIGAASLLVAISCLALSMLLDPRSPGELIVKDLWKNVFEALRAGDGKKIIESVQELAKQKEKRADAFTGCLGTMNPDDTMPFFHKTCFIGYLQMALDNLRSDDDDLAKSNAHLALSHFDASGFSPEFEKFAKSIADSPAKTRALIANYEIGKDLHALDHLLFYCLPAFA